jgi:acetyl esterase/lipase
LVHAPAQLTNNNSAILYFHGGGWIVGSPFTHADISQALCEFTGLRVFSVDYRLAPEHAAPAPIEDGIAVLDEILSLTFHQGGCETAFLCGDSAGGAIALAIERAVSPRTRKKILGVASLYGAFGLLESRSLRLWGNREDGLDPQCVCRMWKLANVPGEISPYSIVALSDPSEVPTYIMAATQDPLLDDSLTLVERLRAIGRRTVVDLVEGESHGFLHDVSRSANAALALRRLSAWMGMLHSAARA